MVNPFKKRQQKKAAAAAHSTPPTDYASFPSSSKLPPRPGIFIASAPAAPTSLRPAPQQQRVPAPPTSSPPSQQQSLDHVLPPASDYRQSLIMPHLTRRFTLLRAPDGSLVSPDAMRAHLRAQRARARAANVAISSRMESHVHFLTEDEENEIIEQLKAQARAEGRDFDLEQPSPAAVVDSWRDGYAAGTDGFGSWGPVASNNANKLSSIAEKLGDLSSNPGHTSNLDDLASPAWSPARNVGGSSFTGRSAVRDHAYFRSAHKERNTSKADEMPRPLKADSSLAASQEASPEAITSADLRSLSFEPTRLASESGEDLSMPGGYNAVEGSKPSAPTPPTQQGLGAVNGKLLLDVPGLDNVSHSRTSQGSNLLTTLSPEAFKRVSTALDEVFGLIASERDPSPATKEGARSLAESPHRGQRSSVDSDANSFASAVSHVRAGDTQQSDPPVTKSSAAKPDSSAEEEEEGEASADRTITGRQPSLDVGQIEHGSIVLASSLPKSLHTSLTGSHPEFASDLSAPQTATQLPALAASDSTLTVTGTNRGVSSIQGASPPSMLAPTPSQHLSVSGSSVAESTLRHPSERSSTAATEVPGQASRIVSAASTIDAHGLYPNESAAGVTAPSSAASAAAASGPTSSTSESVPLPHDQARRPMEVAEGQDRVPRPPRSPEINTIAFVGSPARSMLSRGDSIVSAGSVRSSITGASASNSGTHSRKSSADKLALARSMAPHPNLREQPSLSSVRRNYRQHVRSRTGSSEGSLMGGPASRRSSGAMSPAPVLSRSARSPNYFPPPASNASMHDYAAGFKPPSAISPAATAALQSMNNPSTQLPQPMQSSVMDASNALRSAQSMRNSASTNQSMASPHATSYAAFTSGSDRAVATSSPETGSTSFSLHQRDASHSSANQRSQTQPARIATTEGVVSPSMYVPRPAPVPRIDSQPSQMGDERGLMPNPPSDPAEAERWRAIYGIKASDAVSLRASSDDVTADPNEDEDLWARMASAPEQTISERPVSSLPPGMAQDRLTGTGITFDQIADFQDRLLQTVNGGESIPPLPRIQADNDDQRQKFADAKSKGLASPNLVTGTSSEWSKPAASVQVGDGLAFAGSDGNKSIDFQTDAQSRRNASSSLSHDPPISPRAVLYDVTTSHRPTSPPLHSRNGSLNGLPSLLELNGSIGHRSQGSFSLSQAVDQASRLPRHPAFAGSSIAEDPDPASDQTDQYAVANPVQEHPFNAGYTSPSLSSTTPSSGANGFAFPRKPSQAGKDDIGHSPRSPVQSHLQEDVWHRYGPQQAGATPEPFSTTSPGSPLAHASDPTRLLDDIAAQTSAATRALKGTGDGTMPTPPFRTKSISRKKSFKKVSKQISSPQLISTTQKLDHATQLPPSLSTPTSQGKANKRSNRSAGWGSLGNIGTDSPRVHARASPSGASQSGSVTKSSGYFHRRRSSSFGHEASPSEGFGPSHGTSSTTSIAVEQNKAERTHPNHPYMNGGINGGSLSRLFSKIKSRKHADQGYGSATIEPFPPELHAVARASDNSSQQAPATPELPTLPPVESSAPWTLPRMPSSVDSDRNSSARSPTSPIYTLPIDSTSTPRSKSKKKRAPIVLKPESEVILPGDSGTIPTAIIGRSSKEQSRKLPGLEAKYQPEDDAAATTAVELKAKQLSTDANPDSAAPKGLDNYQSPEPSGTLAPVAVPIEEDESLTPKHASSPAPAAEISHLAEHRDETAPQDDADTTLPATTTEATDSMLPSRSADARKSLRDTIVRRTIIIPSGIDFAAEHRRSLFASSPRKSRRFAAAEDEPIPTSSSSGPAAESPADNHHATLPGEGGDEPGLISTLSSRRSLHPDASSGLKSDRVSRAESSYAGSLYDMYAEGIEFGSPGSETQELPAAARRSRLPEPRRHIEVTERADGSVVWQIIAGLADERASVYSDFDARHSRHLSDTSALSGSGLARDHEEATVYRTPAGLTDDDSRSFFTRPRAGGAAHKKSFSFDRSIPLPTLTSARQDVFEIANPPAAVDASSHPRHHSGSVEPAAEPTRIVYHNDAQLASLLTVLANGKDSAKFQFHINPTQPLVSHAQTQDDGPRSSWTRGVVDADDIESHRSRVEAEIYTLLNQHALAHV